MCYTVVYIYKLHFIAAHMGTNIYKCIRMYVVLIYTLHYQLYVMIIKHIICVTYWCVHACICVCGMVWCSMMCMYIQYVY